MGPAPTPAASQGSGPQETTQGCACREQWRYQGQMCTDYCCNPDSDSGGDWCRVADAACQGTWWGYCGAGQTAPVQTTETASTTQATGTLPSCSAPAARSRGQCESCLQSDQCPEGYYCCPYMKKCVSSSSMSCFYPIASCSPTCRDSKCTSEGCDCSTCSNVGVGKQFSWLVWANLQNSNAGSAAAEVTCS